MRLRVVHGSSRIFVVVGEDTQTKSVSSGDGMNVTSMSDIVDRSVNFVPRLVLLLENKAERKCEFTA